MYFGSLLDTNFFKAPLVFPVVRNIVAVPLFIIVILWTSYFKRIYDLLVKQAAKSRDEADGLNCISTSFIRQLENIIYMFCIVLQNKKSDVYPSRAFPFCLNKDYFAIIDMNQQTAPPWFFL